MKRLLCLLLLLTSCTTYDLGNEWSPLSTVIERPSLPFASDTATTTVGSHVYTTDLAQWLIDYPPGSVEFHALMLHEQAHARRQFRYMGLPGEMAKTAWIAQYLTDPKFRWQEEQAGFYVGIKHLQANGHWDRARTLRSAHAMSSHYNDMVSFQEAQAWIEDVLAGRWAPE
jgi:hypothetical protein